MNAFGDLRRSRTWVVLCRRWLGARRRGRGVVTSKSIHHASVEPFSAGRSTCTCENGALCGRSCRHDGESHHGSAYRPRRRGIVSQPQTTRREEPGQSEDIRSRAAGGGPPTATTCGGCRSGSAPAGPPDHRHLRSPRRRRLPGPRACRASEIPEERAAGRARYRAVCSWRLAS